MERITPDTRLQELLDRYPWLMGEAVRISGRFRLLATPMGKKLLKKATISDLSRKGGIPEDEIIGKIYELISEHPEPDGIGASADDDPYDADDDGMYE